MRILKTLAVTTALAAAAGTAYADETLDAVKEKGFVQCGVSQGLPGFSNPDDQGNWTGLDVDYCRAIASAVFNDAEAVKFTPLSAYHNRIKRCGFFPCQRFGVHRRRV